MADDEKKTSEDVTEEEQQHEPAQPEPEQDEDEQDECDEAIAGLLAEIDRLSTRISELERAHVAHESEYEHSRRVEAGSADGVEPTPEERHFYFRRIKRA